MDPAQEDVARRLEQPLAFHDPLSVVGVPALARVRLEHRRFRLLDLEEQRVGVVLAQHQRDPAPGADAADPDDLPGEVDQPIALQEMSPIRLQAVPVDAEPIVEPGPQLFDDRPRRAPLAGELVERHHERRVADDAELAVDLARELGERLRAVLGLRLGRHLLEALDLCWRSPRCPQRSRIESTSRRAYQVSRFVSAGELCHRLPVRAHAADRQSSRAVLAENSRDRAAISKLAASRFTSHSNGPGFVSSKSLMSNTSVRSGDANPPKFARCASPQHWTRKPESGVVARSDAMTIAAPR